jgi:glycosyltransferase involved in cell wall biosynthesis
MSKRILVVCPYPENEAPGQRLKYEQYFEYFRSNGYEIHVSPFIEPAFYKILYTPGHYVQKIVGVLWGYAKRILQIFSLPFYDGVYVFLYVTPFGSSFYERIYRLLAKRMIYDIDDLAFVGKTSSNNRLVAPLRGPGKYFYLMRVADHVITCTPYLDALVRKYNTKTTDISSTINTDKYIPIDSYSNDHRLVLGWSGSHSTVPYLRLLEPVLRELSKHFDFKLLVIGTTKAEFAGINCEAIAWSESTEVRDLRRIDIGLYCLPDEEWVYGKSGLKALQYMALGIPTVATAIGANFRIIENGESGFLVNSNDEWIACLGELLSNPALRERIGKNARERVVQRYSVRANEPVYLKIFRDVFR